MIYRQAWLNLTRTSRACSWQKKNVLLPSGVTEMSSAGAGLWRQHDTANKNIFQSWSVTETDEVTVRKTSFFINSRKPHKQKKFKYYRRNVSNESKDSWRSILQLTGLIVGRSLEEWNKKRPNLSNVTNGSFWIRVYFILSCIFPNMAVSSNPNFRLLATFNLTFILLFLCFVLFFLKFYNKREENTFQNRDHTFQNKSL